MRVIFLSVIVFIFTLFVPGQTKWKRIDSGTLSWLRAIHFADSQTGWIGGTAGTLLMTEDGGRTWNKSPSPVKDDIRDIYFRNARRGWLLCERDIFGRDANSPTYILATNDGGKSWEQIDVEPGRERMLRLVPNSDRELMYALGEMGTFLKASVDGKKFSRFRLSGYAMLTSGYMLDAKRGIVVGGNGTIVVTENGGVTWIPIFFSDSNSSGRMSKLNSLFFLDSATGWAVGNSGTALTTGNGGRTWTSLKIGTESDLNDVLFLDDKIGVTIGHNGTMLTTVDGGRTWSKENSGTKHRLERLGAASGQFFAIGFGGTLLVRPFTH
jgi:photosystem II stability/assembly factor-like uncharacterized protein